MKFDLLKNELPTTHGDDDNDNTINNIIMHEQYFEYGNSRHQDREQKENDPTAVESLDTASCCNVPDTAPPLSLLSFSSFSLSRDCLSQTLVSSNDQQREQKQQQQQEQQQQQHNSELFELFSNLMTSRIVTINSAAFLRLQQQQLFADTRAISSLSSQSPSTDSSTSATDYTEEEDEGDEITSDRRKCLLQNLEQQQPNIDKQQQKVLWKSATSKTAATVLTTCNYETNNIRINGENQFVHDRFIYRNDNNSNNSRVQKMKQSNRGEALSIWPFRCCWAASTDQLQQSKLNHKRRQQRGGMGTAILVGTLVLFILLRSLLIPHGSNNNNNSNKNERIPNTAFMANIFKQQQRQRRLQENHSISTSPSCNCLTSLDPGCCERLMLRAHKMGVVLLRDLILNNPSFRLKNPTARVQQKSKIYLGSEIIDPKYLPSAAGDASATENGHEKRQGDENDTNSNYRDYRHVVVTRPYYDSMVSGYLYHKSGRECWLDQEGRPRSKNKTFEWEPFLTLPYAPSPSSSAVASAMSANGNYNNKDNNRLIPDPRGRTLCQYLAEETEQDGMRAFVDLSLHQLYAGIIPYYEAVQKFTNDVQQQNKTMFVCFEELSNPATQEMTFHNIVHHLHPGASYQLAASVTGNGDEFLFPAARKRELERQLELVKAGPATATAFDSYHQNESPDKKDSAASEARKYGGGHSTSKDPELRKRLLALAETFDTELFDAQGKKATQLLGCDRNGNAVRTKMTVSGSQLPSSSYILGLLEQFESGDAPFDVYVVVLSTTLLTMLFVVRQIALVVSLLLQKRKRFFIKKKQKH